MKIQFLKNIALGSVLAIALVGCEKNDGPDDNTREVSGPDVWDREFVTITEAFPDAEGTPGNGGTMAYALTLEEAADPNFEVDVYTAGYPLRSQRTARVQGS